MNEKIKHKPLVSIAVPFYNVERYLAQNIESLINQTYKNIEILLVDDGSIDNSGKIADNYAKKDKRIKVVHQQNKGFSGARNSTMNIASGDYITFVDADDYVLPEYVEYLLTLAVKANADIAISKNCFTTSNLKQVKTLTFEIYSPEQAVENFFYPYIQLGSWNKIYRMSFLKENNIHFIPELKTGEGLQFITLAASLSNKVAVGNKKVYVYRVNNPKSATTKANVEKQGLGALQTLQYIKRNLSMPTKSVQKAFQIHVWNAYRYCLRHIIESSTQKQFHHLYRHCIKYLRRNSYKIIFSKIRIKFKIEAFIVLLSPNMMVQLTIKKKKQRMRKKIV